MGLDPLIITAWQSGRRLLARCPWCACVKTVLADAVHDFAPDSKGQCVVCSGCSNPLRLSDLLMARAPIWDGVVGSGQSRKRDGRVSKANAAILEALERGLNQQAGVLRRHPGNALPQLAMQLKFDPGVVGQWVSQWLGPATGPFELLHPAGWATVSTALQLIFEGHTSGILSVAFSPDGRQVLTGSSDHTARLWDATSGAEKQRFDGHTSPISSVAFSPDGRQVLTGSYGQTARLWDATSGAEKQRFAGHTDWIRSVAFSPDGRQVLTGSDDKTARLWDATSGAEKQRFEGHTSGIRSVAFSPDGRQVLTGSDGDTARLWDATSGAEKQRFEGHTGWITSVAFSQDGRQVLTGSTDQTARLSDAASGAEKMGFEGHTSWITSVAFSPDGRQVLTGSWDHAARLWDATSGEEKMRFEGHTGNMENTNPVAAGRVTKQGTDRPRNPAGPGQKAHPFRHWYNPRNFAPWLRDVRRGKYDSVYLSTPPAVTGGHYLPQLARGGPRFVLAEKPWWLSFAAALHAAPAIRRSSVIFRFADHYPHKPVMRWLLRQPIGFLLGGSITSVTGWLYESSAPSSPAQSIGVLSDLLIHALTVTRMLLPGRRIDVTGASAARYRGAPFPTETFASLDAVADDMQPVQIRLAAAKGFPADPGSNPAGKVLLVSGPEATLRLDFASDTADLITPAGTRPLFKPETPDDTEDAYTNMIRRLSEGDTTIGLNLDEALDILRILDAARNCFSRSPLAEHDRTELPPAMTAIESIAIEQAA